MDANIIVYGIGVEAERFIYTYKFSGGCRIKYFIEEKKCGFFHGIPIVSFDDIDCLENYYIYVAAEWDVYEEKKKILESLGLRQYINFQWSKEYNKKIVIFNTNCYGELLDQMLMKSKKFRDNYVIHKIPLVHENSEIDESLLNHVDVYIHQYIRSNSSVGYKLSDEYILPRLKQSCVTITIPNLVGMGNWMFPQQRELLGSCGNHNELTPFFRDIVLDEAFERGILILEDYMEYYNNYEFSKEMLEQSYNLFCSRILEREEKWDIKIADYIFSIMNDFPCFIDCGHPSLPVMKEIGWRLAKYLEVEDCKMKRIEEIPFGLPSPILQKVKAFYGFKFETCQTMKNRYSLRYAGETLADYIKEYIWWNYDVMIE